MVGSAGFMNCARGGLSHRLQRCSLLLVRNGSLVTGHSDPCHPLVVRIIVTFWERASVSIMGPSVYSPDSIYPGCPSGPAGVLLPSPPAPAIHLEFSPSPELC